MLISDLLYYVFNKLKSQPVKDVVATCHRFYTDDNYVFCEKKKLYDAVGEICSSRKKEEKRMKNIEDICATIIRRDSKNEFIPKFASLNLNNVPLNAEGDPSLGQIMAAINEIKICVKTNN